MKRKYDSAVGAFFSESARGLPVEQQTKVMTEMSRLFRALDLHGAPLSPSWFQKPENRQKVETGVPTDVRTALLRGFDAVAGAKTTLRDEGHHKLVIEGGDQEHPGLVAR